MTNDEREFWKAVYIAAIRAGLDSTDARGRAYKALANLNGFDAGAGV